MRYLLIDRVLEVVPGERIVAVKNVTLESSYLEQHFPDFPLYPGALVIESFAQAAGYLIARTELVLEGRETVRVLSGIERARFMRPVFPGDQLRIDARLVRRAPAVATCRIVGTVEGTTVARAVLTFALATADEDEHTAGLRQGRTLENVLELRDRDALRP
jgi:3-hydroxyacyl-[acyl-carrier-protein] dehydratase